MGAMSSNPRAVVLIACWFCLHATVRIRFFGEAKHLPSRSTAFPIHGIKSCSNGGPAKYNGSVVTRRLVRGLRSNGFELFSEILNDTGLLDELPSVLSCRDATVFAPSDAVIRALPRAVAQQLERDLRLLREVALLHFITGKKRLRKLASQRRGHQYITLAFNGLQRLKKASLKGDWKVRVYTDKGPKVTVTRGNFVMLRSVAVHGVNGVIRPKVLVTKGIVSGQ